MSDESIEPVFVASGAHVFYGQDGIMIDFQQLMPMFNRTENKALIIEKHKRISLYPETAKELLKVLKEKIADYEKEYEQKKS